MNRALLIIICDFLVLSLLSLARFDVADSNPPAKAPEQQLSTEAPTDDVVETLSAALEQERQSRQELLGELAEARQSLTQHEQIVTEQEKTLTEQERALNEQQRILEERARRLAAFQQQLQRKEEEARRLEADRARLQQEYVQTQTSVQSLQKQVAETTTEARVSQAQLEAIQAELRRRLDEAERMQQKMGELETARRTTEAEKHQLATQLQVAETEKRLVRAQVDAMVDEIQIVREEKERLHNQTTKLSEGVTSLAQQSSALTQEIRENRPLAPNTIFSDFVANRVHSDFQAIRRGIFGREVSRQKEAKTILVNDGMRTYALFHIDDTPLTFADPGTDWDWLTGNLRRKSAVVPIDQLWFLHTDPRIAVVPLTESQAQQLNGKIYHFASDPYKFQDAVVVGASEGYYGECRFELDPALPQYIKMERSTLRGLFGKFNPSRGDLVFSKSGELLGLMVNNDHCALLSNLSRARAIRFGIDIADQRTGFLLAEMRGRIDRLPAQLH